MAVFQWTGEEGERSGESRRIEREEVEKTRMYDQLAVEANKQQLTCASTRL